MRELTQGGCSAGATRDRLHRSRPAQPSFTWISSQFPSNTILTWWSRLGPWLAGIGIGRQPSGIIPTVGEDLRAQNARKRAEREAAGLPPAPRPDTTPPAPQPPGVEQQAPVASPGA